MDQHTSTFTPGPPFTSPRSTPTFTATPRPAPIPHPIEFITNPTEAYVLSQRYFRNRGRGDAQGADASDPQFDGEEAQPMHAPEARSLYLTDAQKGLWNPQELAAKARQYPGRTWG